MNQHGTPISDSPFGHDSLLLGPARLVIILFIAAITLLAASIIVVYRVGLIGIGAERRMSSQLLVWQHLDDFLSALKDAETGQRGYVLTGDAPYLAPYTQGLARVEFELNNLQQLASSGVLTKDKVAEIAGLTLEKLGELERTIRLRREAGLQAALEVIRDDHGKALMDRIRVDIGALRTAQEERFAQASRQAAWAGNVRTAAFIAAGLVNLLFLIWAAKKILQEIHLREEAIQETTRQKELLATTLASIGDAVVMTDSDGRVTFVNAEAEKLTGWKSADANGQPLPTIFRIINESTRQPVENPVDKVLRLGTVVGLANHTVLVSKDGRETPIDDSAAPIRRGGGPVFGVVLVFRDVTQQRNAYAANAQLAAVVQFSGDAIFTKNLDGIVQSWNASAERLFGYKAEEIVGKPVTVLFPPERLKEEDYILGRLRQGQPSERLETVRVAKGGRRIHVSVSVSPLKNAEGEVIGASKIIHDVTELVATREALVKEKQLLATTLASIGDAVIVTNETGNVTFLNTEAERLTGWQNAEAHDRPLNQVFRILNEQTREIVENPVEKVIRLGNVVGLANHTILVAKDGKEFPIDDSAAPIREPDGPLLGVVLVFRDFTEHKLAAKRLHELSLLPEQNPAPVLRISREGLLLYANPATFGRLQPWDLRLGEEAPAAIKMLAEEALREERVAEREVDAGGHTFFVTVVPIPELGYANLYCIDVTERKRAEEALRAKGAELETIINRTPFMLTLCSRDLRYRFVSQAYAGMLGRPAAEVAGKPIRDIMGEPGLNAIAPYISQVLQGQKVEYESNIPFRGIGTRSLHVTYIPEKDERGEVQGWIASILDVTARKQAEEELRAAHAQLADRAVHLEKLVEERTANLRQMIAELQHVSYAITHDMRAPLRAMSTFATIVFEELSTTHTSAQAQDFCRRIIAAAKRLDKLIQDSLNYTKAVLQEVPLQPIDLSKLVSGLVESYPNLQPDKADIIIEEPLPVVSGDESLLTQCFSNLLGNAVKFVGPGVRPRIRVSAQRHDGFATVTVEDNGIGIPPIAQSRLFGMFQRLTNEYEGTGIGLAIVRKVVERMGGKVGAESQPGQGSRFWVDLRLASESGKAAGGA